MALEIEVSERLKRLPPYLFVEIDNAKQKAMDDGRDIIDLGVGDPDIATPKKIVDALYKASSNPKTHHYPSNFGLLKFREEIAEWYKKRFNVLLDPYTEIIPLLGSKEGIAHIPLAFVNPGDKVLVSDPGYPPYKTGTIFAGGRPVIMPLLEENDFLPDLDALAKEDLKDTKLMFVNYPNNPTGAVANQDFFEKLIKFADEHNIIVCHDAAYTEMFFDDKPQHSFLETPGAKKVGIEFHSLSKTYNMTGWRIGFACGNKEIIAGLGKVKSNIDSGVFEAIQLAGIEALRISEEDLKLNRSIYELRRDVLVKGLNELGWNVSNPVATFYLWIKVPNSLTSSDFAKMLLEKTNIIVTPGIGFGPTGEGYIRMALTVSKERIKEALNRLKIIQYA